MRTCKPGQARGRAAATGDLSWWVQRHCGGEGERERVKEREKERENII